MVASEMASTVTADRACTGVFLGSSETCGCIPIMRIVNLKNPSYHYRQRQKTIKIKGSEDNYYDAPDSFWNSNRPAGRHLGADARLLAKGRRMGLRLAVGLRPLLSHLRARPDRTMHGELDAARRTQPAHQTRAHRRLGQR